ncbi:hypothetical protein QTP70_001279 [Hemibagrus guttatus]|uniref:Uncharacterized protein n=1 Tax=Hemibagrus guttatus TaxID=175788 RepID=A0AAE0Q612_9TELE|nr:hypothetical protein QTP70_001279 [Hemibagrus guttatus]
MLYGLETVSLRKRQESELEVAELKMLRFKSRLFIAAGRVSEVDGVVVGHPGTYANSRLNEKQHPAGCQFNVRAILTLTAKRSPVELCRMKNIDYLQHGSATYRIPDFLTIPALVDSGVAVNLIDQHLVEKLHLPRLPCKTPLQVTAIDNHTIGKGLITQQTSSLTLQVGLLHFEEIQFFIICSPANPIILGFP